MKLTTCVALLVAVGLGGCTDDPGDRITPPSTDLILVPQPEGQCDMDYDKRLQNVGLQASEISVHGPDDQDFKGYGCAYRITPAPGSSVSSGASVIYRSAWEVD